MQCVRYKALWLPGRSCCTGLECQYRFISRSRFRAMGGRTYEDAVDALNTLQTDFRVLEERRKAGIKQDENVIAEMKAWSKRIGHSTRDFDSLNIVQVAGTKGKGTVCAYVDSILSFYRKSHGIPKKVGLFTSPHLVSVRERIRINSEPISAPLFAKYFFEIWDLLESSAQALSVDPTVKPVYFRYLTLMSLYVFLKEGVDVAVYEVGLGGEYDCTNTIERPAAIGISTLGIDHVFLLGDSVDKIAWHKAGIMKAGSPAFSTEQAPEAMEVVKSRAHEKGVDVKVVQINPALQNVKIKPGADFQRRNASLAIALADTVLRKIDPSFSLPEKSLPKEFVDGLEQVVWRGRFETKVDGNIRWYLDGAHTADSLIEAALWFASQSSTLKGSKVLIFNQQGRPEAVELLEGLYKALESQGLVRFDHIIFCTNVTYSRKGYQRDFLNHTYDSKAVASLTMQKQFATKWKSLNTKASVAVVPSIEEALEYVKILARSSTNEKGVGEEAQALITGSLHLVGGALSILEGATTL